MPANQTVDEQALLEQVAKANYQMWLDAQRAAQVQHFYEEQERYRAERDRYMRAPITSPGTLRPADSAHFQTHSMEAEMRPPVDVSKVEECDCGASLVVRQDMGLDVPKPYSLVHGTEVVARLRLSTLNKLGGFAPRVLLPKLGGCPDAGNRKAYRGWFK